MFVRPSAAVTLDFLCHTQASRSRLRAWARACSRTRSCRSSRSSGEPDDVSVTCSRDSTSNCSELSSASIPISALFVAVSVVRYCSVGGTLPMPRMRDMCPRACSSTSFWKDMLAARGSELQGLTKNNQWLPVGSFTLCMSLNAIAQFCGTKPLSNTACPMEATR